MDLLEPFRPQVLISALSKAPAKALLWEKSLHVQKQGLPSVPLDIIPELQLMSEALKSRPLFRNE